MNTILLSALALLAAQSLTSLAQPAPPPPPPPPQDAGAPESEMANYVIRVEWRSTRSGTNHVQFVSADGKFTLNSAHTGKDRSNDTDPPVTLNLRGHIEPLSIDRARLTLFLGRTMPYVTGTSQTPMGVNKSYQQLQLGLDTNLVVKMGRPVVLQSDENEEVVVLVKRDEG